MTDVATLKARRALRVLATPNFEPPRAFSASRWPYTYAYDHVRARGLADSRGEAGQLVKDLAKKADLPVEFVLEMLATAYCTENNVEMPALWLDSDAAVRHS